MHALRHVAHAPLHDVARGAAVRGVVAHRLTPRALATPVATRPGIAQLAGRAGVAAGAALVVLDVHRTFRSEGHVGTRTRHAAGRGIGGVAGGLAGAKLGGALGATIGTAILPGAGTAVGGLLGAVTGAIIGAKVGVKVGDAVVSLGEHAVAGAKDIASKLNPF